MLMLEGITRLRCLRVRGVKDIRVLILVVVALRRSFDDSRLSKSRGVQDTFCSFAVPIIANQLCRRPTRHDSLPAEPLSAQGPQRTLHREYPSTLQTCVLPRHRRCCC